MRVNIGCDQSPTPGWKNFDNSFSLQLATAPLVFHVLSAIGALDERQKRFIRFVRHSGVQYADATRRIPLRSHSAEVLYSSHMLEHFDQQRVRCFLAEARRVLKSGGIIRIAVPDVGLIAKRYMSNGDADDLVRATHLVAPTLRTALDRLRFLLIGDRHHLWMYDGRSLCRLLTEAGFLDARVTPVGTTRMPDPGDLNLSERSDDSVYVEALNP